MTTALHPDLIATARVLAAVRCELAAATHVIPSPSAAAAPPAAAAASPSGASAAGGVERRSRGAPVAQEMSGRR